MADKPESFGKYLRQKREARGVTREDISRSTKISRNVIEALEADDYRFLPEDTFIRGYIRAYARELNLPSDDMVQHFRRFRENLDKKKESEKEKEYPPPIRFSLSPRVKSIAITGIVLGGITTYFLISSLKESPPREERESGPRTIHKQAVAPVPLSAPIEPTIVPETLPPVGAEVSRSIPKAARGVPLVLMARENVWVKYSVDGGETSEILMKPGESFRIKGEKKFDLLIGNAGGVELVFNGKPFPALGPSGRVVHLRLPVAPAGE